MIVLVDQDGVLADFSGYFYTLWGLTYPDHSISQQANERSSLLMRSYPVSTRKTFAPIHSKHFFRDLPPVSGALAGISQIVLAGHEVFICTSPVTDHKFCLTEKQEWVEEHLGPWFARRLIITQDKTLVHGDVLIDDKPVVEGLVTPRWVHMMFDAPYNRHIKTPHRVNWNTCLEALSVFS